MSTKIPEVRTLAQDRRSMHEWGVVSVIAGGAAIADLAIEGGLAAVPGIGWIADVINLVPELTFAGIAIFAINRFFHYRHEVHKKTGRAHPDSLPPQIPRRAIPRL